MVELRVGPHWSGDEQGTDPRSGWSLVVGGAAGIRTPDLLIANETRYQLRHSPLMRTKQ